MTLKPLSPFSFFFFFFLKSIHAKVVSPHSQAGRGAGRRLEQALGSRGGRVLRGVWRGFLSSSVLMELLYVYSLAFWEMSFLVFWPCGGRGVGGAEYAGTRLGMLCGTWLPRWSSHQTGILAAITTMKRAGRKWKSMLATVLERDFNTFVDWCLTSSIQRLRVNEI